MRLFPTDGPVRLNRPGSIRPSDRVNADEVPGVAPAERGFVLPAPRHTGKTSSLITARASPSCGDAGRSRGAEVDVEAAPAARGD